MAKKKKKKDKPLIRVPKVRHHIMGGLYDYQYVPGKVYPASVNHITTDEDGNITVHIQLERDR